MARRFETGWGLEATGAGLASARSVTPAAFGFAATGGAEPRAWGYDRVERAGGRLRGSVTVDAPGGGRLAVFDQWRVVNGVLELDRRVAVARPAPGGFFSGATFTPAATVTRADLAFFAPGVIYGGVGPLTAAAIGGADTYRTGGGATWIREDRLPAPLFATRFRDGTSIAVLHPAPRGGTTAAEGAETAPGAMTDVRFAFGAVGAQVTGGRVETGFRFPGTEGEVTYRGDTYPGGQLRGWRYRFHPLRKGFVQSYRVRFRFGADPSFSAFVRDHWRWAWSALSPRVEAQDLQAARRSLVDLLAARTETVGDRTGIPQFVPAPRTGPSRGRDRRANLGFVGKNLEAAEFMLAEADRDPGPRGARLRDLGGRIIDSFVRLPMSPPAGEGFHLDTGEPSIFTDPGRGPEVVYLRPLADDMKALMRAIRRERTRGREHPAWLGWARGFGDWLLTQQLSDGGFPRAWTPRTGAVAIDSPASSYNPIPFLLLLAEVTGDARYRAAAVRAGEFTWARARDGVFVGGTIDNPDVVDKEAGTLSLEAFLALRRATGERKWLDRARAAADYAETWIYLWNVPMPTDGGGVALGWKPGVPTTGAQLISTGHSLVDQYMAFDVDEYAELGTLTGDPHYTEVARLLLHNTKTMLALPGRTFDLKGPGWQQEHWSFAPRRGQGLHRGWLPWVATSHLNGLFGLWELDPALYARLAGGGAPASQPPPPLAVNRSAGGRR